MAHLRRRSWHPNLRLLGVKKVKAGQVANLPRFFRSFSLQPRLLGLIVVVATQVVGVIDFTTVREPSVTAHCLRRLEPFDMAIGKDVNFPPPSAIVGPSATTSCTMSLHQGKGYRARQP